MKLPAKNNHSIHCTNHLIKTATVVTVKFPAKNIILLFENFTQTRFWLKNIKNNSFTGMQLLERIKHLFTDTQMLV